MKNFARGFAPAVKAMDWFDWFWLSFVVFVGFVFRIAAGELMRMFNP